MSNRDLSLALRLYADSARFVAGLTQAEGGVRRFARGAKGEVEALRGAMGSLRGQLATLGVSVGAVATAAQSARMDKSLGQIGRTAGMSRDEVEQLRAELFRMAGDTGQLVDDLQVGFSNAVASGLKFNEALPVIGATNKAMAVTGANAERLTAGLTVAAAAFNFDLAKPKLALSLLDKMTVAGRLGNAELENLSDIFARVGVNASSAGMGFDQTLALIEVLSKVERQPERLATLADSTLRLFTNLKYMKAAAEATGVKFFDPKTGARRDPADVFKDIKSQYDKLTTDKSRAIFLQKAFGEADLDTIKGLRTLFGGDMLGDLAKFTGTIGGAGETLKRELPEAISNAVDQTGRLKNALRNAADDFARPINAAIESAIRWGLDKKENGGLGLDGKDIMIGGALGAAGLFGAARYGGKAVSALGKRFGSTAAGVAEGKALEAAAGVTPVFVVNWPASSSIGGVDVPGAPGQTTTTTGKTAMGASALRIAGTAGLALAPLAAMYGVKSWAEDTSNDIGRAAAIGEISNSVKAILGLVGFNKDAEFADRLARNRADLGGEAQIRGEIRVRLDQDGRATSVTAASTNPRVTMSVDAGRTMVSP